MQESRTEIDPDIRVGDVLHNITDDVKMIARDELELAKAELQRTAKRSAMDIAVAMLGGVVALVGLGLLCVAAVDALSHVIAPLWLRLLIMAFVYLVVGGVVAGAFAKRLRKDASPDLSNQARDIRHTIDRVKEGLR
jgi:uncharacterized membrane protein YqjE